jgi:hypothetical protein
MTVEEKIKWLVAEHARAILAAEKAEREREEALGRAEMIASIHEALLRQEPRELHADDFPSPSPKPDQPATEEPETDAYAAYVDDETCDAVQAKVANLSALAQAASRRKQREEQCEVDAEGEESERHDPHGALRIAAAKHPQMSKAGLSDDDAEEADHGKPVDIGNGKREIRDGTHFANCIDALRARSPHWLTPAGAFEVIKNEIQRNVSSSVNTTICELFRDQRTRQPYNVPGLQMRRNGTRFEYRIAYVDSPA